MQMTRVKEKLVKSPKRPKAPFAERSVGRVRRVPPPPPETVSSTELRNSLFLSFPCVPPCSTPSTPSITVDKQQQRSTTLADCQQLFPTGTKYVPSVQFKGSLGSITANGRNNHKVLQTT